MAASSVVMVYPLDGSVQCGSKPLYGDTDVPGDFNDPSTLPTLLGTKFWTLTAVYPSSCNGWLVQVQPPLQEPRPHHGPGPDPTLTHPRLVSLWPNGYSRLLFGDDLDIGPDENMALPALLRNHWAIVGSLYLNNAGWLAWVEYHGVPKP
jgi:hypothetical protein